MAEEGGGGHSDGGPSSAIGSAQRLPPPPPPPAPQPGSQAPPAPALAPDQLPQNNTLVALPIVAIENILSFMSYDEISQLRLVRPPRDPRRPLRRPRSGEGRRGERVPRGGSRSRLQDAESRCRAAGSSPLPAAGLGSRCPGPEAGRRRELGVPAPPGLSAGPKAPAAAFCAPASSPWPGPARFGRSAGITHCVPPPSPPTPDPGFPVGEDEVGSGRPPQTRWGLRGE